jgi:hypothetical protein
MMPTTFRGVLVVVPDGVLVDPEVLAANRPMDLEGQTGGVGGPEGNDGFASDPFSALRELQNGVVRVDLGRAGDVVGTCIEVILDHRARDVFIHFRNLLLLRWSLVARSIDQTVGAKRTM